MEIKESISVHGCRMGSCESPKVTPEFQKQFTIHGLPHGTGGGGVMSALARGGGVWSGEVCGGLRR